jgi:hypothetical protein
MSTSEANTWLSTSKERGWRERSTLVYGRAINIARKVIELRRNVKVGKYRNDQDNPAEGEPEETAEETDKILN